ncbi:MAG TPA: hypothetical protein GXX57_06710 [Firmicutes bacterium]|nr:hypothetical protein [Bacillota bacterium]
MRVRDILIYLGLIAILILAGCIMITEEPSEPDNLLPNSSFEWLESNGKPTGWPELPSWNSNATVEVDTTVAHTGNNSIKIHCPTDDDRGSASLFLEVTPGQTYRFRGWVKTEGLSGFYTNKGPVARFSLLENKEDPSAKYTLYGQGTGSADWELVETAFVVPPGINWIRLDLFLLYQQGTVWWDDVEFFEMNQANLLPNGSFEILRDGVLFRWGKDNWGTGAQVSIDESTAKDGTNSVKIYAPTAQDRGGVNHRLMVIPGATYRFSAWAKTEGVVGGDLEDKGPLARILFYESDQATSGQQGILVHVPKVQDWTYVSHEFTVPAGMVSMRIDLFMYYQQGTVWWDDVQLAFVSLP